MKLGSIGKYKKVYRPSWVEINLAHIKHNCRMVKQLVGKDGEVNFNIERQGNKYHSRNH